MVLERAAVDQAGVVERLREEVSSAAIRLVIAPWHCNRIESASFVVAGGRRQRSDQEIERGVGAGAASERTQASHPFHASPIRSFSDPVIASIHVDAVAPVDGGRHRSNAAHDR